jgi:hypothetical protein
VVGEATGFDRDEGGIDRAHPVHRIERRMDGRERQRSMEQEHLDERPGPGSITSPTAGQRPEALVGARERARLAGLGERDRAR